MMTKVNHVLGLYETLAQGQVLLSDVLIASVFADFHRLSGAAEIQA